MLGQISSVKVSEWIAWLRLEHMGDGPEERADLRMAFGSAHLLAAWVKKPPKINDLMPQFEKPEQTPEQLHAALVARANADERRAQRAQKRKADGGGDREIVRGAESQKRRVHEGRPRGGSRDRASEESAR